MVFVNVNVTFSPIIMLYRLLPCAYVSSVSLLSINEELIKFTDPPRA